jgi:hypothetical protein
MSEGRRGLLEYGVGLRRGGDLLAEARWRSRRHLACCPLGSARRSYHRWRREGWWRLRCGSARGRVARRQHRIDVHDGGVETMVSCSFHTRTSTTVLCDVCAHSRSRKLFLGRAQTTKNSFYTVAKSRKRAAWDGRRRDASKRASDGSSKGRVEGSMAKCAEEWVRSAGAGAGPRRKFTGQMQARARAANQVRDGGRDGRPDCFEEVSRGWDESAQSRWQRGVEQQRFGGDGAALGCIGRRLWFACVAEG